MRKCLTDLDEERKISVGRMKDTVRSYKDSAKAAEEDMLRILKEARSSLVGQGRPDTPPRA
eukprot:12269107-Karenia_brevis.AAC.1